MHSITLQEIPYQANSEILFEAVRDLPEAVWLDSGKPRSTQGRYDIISAAPDALIETRGNLSTVSDSSGTSTSEQDPFELAQQLLEPLQPFDNSLCNSPFVGGLIGYFGLLFLNHPHHFVNGPFSSVAKAYLFFQCSV